MSASTPTASYTAWREMGADVGPHDFDDVIRGEGEACLCDCSQHGQALRRDLEPPLPEQVSWVDHHEYTLCANYDDV